MNCEAQSVSERVIALAYAFIFFWLLSVKSIDLLAVIVMSNQHSTPREKAHAQTLLDVRVA